MNTSLEMEGIEELDPSLSDGYIALYDRECPFEVRFHDSESSSTVSGGGGGTLEAIKVKILLHGEEVAPISIRVELSSENDLFFQYHHIVDLSAFHEMQESQKLMIDFGEYPHVLIKMLNNSIKEPHSHMAVFIINRDGRARLDFIQNLEYKFVELLSVPFARATDDVIRQHITYRYNALKSRLILMQARLQDVSNVVKAKNPSLLLHLNRKTDSPASDRLNTSAKASGRRKEGR